MNWLSGAIYNEIIFVFKAPMYILYNIKFKFNQIFNNNLEKRAHQRPDGRTKVRNHQVAPVKKHSALKNNVKRVFCFLIKKTLNSTVTVLFSTVKNTK